MDLYIRRGDTKFLKFQRKDSEGNPIIESIDKAYFTVKNYSLPEDFIFQKTLADMDIDEEGFYHFRIDPEDTNKMLFSTYRYDLQIEIGAIKRTIAFGNFIVKEEVTFAGNEA